LEIKRGGINLDDYPAEKVIDAENNIVCPGFVDLHSHAGLNILGESHHDPKVRQGVTTELVGIDGISHAPFKTREGLERYIWLNAGLNWCPPKPDWLSTKEHINKYDDKVAVNIAYILGNSHVRIRSFSWEDRPATKAQIADMRAVIRE
jgi:N-acyl-D-amino-acid deacylase